jgi:hypothetical protein
MKIALPNADQINETNVVSAVKQIIHALEITSDLGGFHDSETREELRLLRSEMRAGFENLNERVSHLEIAQVETNRRLGTLESTVQVGFQELTVRFDQLDHGQQQMVELLRQIAHNTKRN